MNDTCSTINVIERVEGRYCQLISFLNTERGSESAERVFGTILREYNDELTDAQIKQYIEDGSFEDGT